MKVYVATGGYDYEGDTVIGVYSTMELAQACINEMKSNPKIHYDDYEIEEYEVVVK